MFAVPSPAKHKPVELVGFQDALKLAELSPLVPQLLPTLLSLLEFSDSVLLSVPSSLDSSLMPRVALSKWSSSSGEGSCVAERGRLRDRV